MTVARPGVAVWFTGLSGSGKTTMGVALAKRLLAKGLLVEVLDGDEVRKHLTKGLGFSKDGRDENIRRIGYVAHMLVRNGVIVIVAAISPYRAVRDEVRARIGEFVEVYMSTSLEVCEERDVKGLYRRARAGDLKGFTGVDDPYEPPMNPEVTVDAGETSVEEGVEAVVRELVRRGCCSSQD